MITKDSSSIILYALCSHFQKRLGKRQAKMDWKNDADTHRIYMTHSNDFWNLDKVVIARRKKDKDWAVMAVLQFQTSGEAYAAFSAMIGNSRIWSQKDEHSSLHH